MSLQYIQPQQVQKKSGILGTLGTLASLAGGLTGQPWLTTLGMGMSGIDNVMNGGGSTSAGGGAQVAKETGETWNKIFKELKEGWKNPASSSGNVAKSSEEQAREEIANRVGGIVQPIATAAQNIGTSQTQWPSPTDYGYGIFGSKGCVVPHDYWRY